jgi:heptosyltransferase I
VDYPGWEKELSISENHTPRKILIVKLSAIGDVIQTFPMAEALRAQFPDAQIDWLVEEDASELLVGHPAISRVTVSRRKAWQKNIFQRGKFWSTLREIVQFIKNLRGTEYDWVIDNHGILKSGLWVLASRGKRKIGFQYSPKIADEGNYLFTRERYKPLDIEKHAVERYMNLISHLGIPVEESKLQYAVKPGAQEKASLLLRQNQLLSRPFVVIHPMAKWPTKQWPQEYFAQLADGLIKKGASVIFTGSEEDQIKVRAILQQVSNPQRILNLVGRTDLQELAGVFSLADLVITTDTGPMHLAAAVQAPLIALFGPTAPWRTGPYGNGHQILRQSISCSPCFKKKCSTMECMNSLSVERVMEAAQQKILKRER